MLISLISLTTFFFENSDTILKLIIFMTLADCFELIFI